jgi:hypothetical protein
MMGEPVTKKKPSASSQMPTSFVNKIDSWLGRLERKL